MWILIPQNEGEKVMYLFLSSYLTTFERKMTYVRGTYLAVVLKAILKLAALVTGYCAVRVSPETLHEVKQTTDQISETIKT